MEFKDITGKKFGRLYVISFIERHNSHTYWDCLCDCGNKIKATNNNLSTGHTKSCGCFRRETVRQTMIRHGMAKTKFWIIWMGLKDRCEKSYNSSFHNYGKRGIKCLWKSFEEFKKDMYPAYLRHVKQFGEKNTTIERINNNGHYLKENCRWATLKEQARNRRNNRFISYKGETKTIVEWAEKYKIAPRVLYDRIGNNWPIEKAVESPVRIL